MNNPIHFTLPSVIKDLVAARDRVKDHYNVPLVDFTFDGKLVGDIGEVVAARIFGISLLPGGGKGIDGHAPDGRSVQVKATNKRYGPAFREIEVAKRADILIFLDFNFGDLCGEVLFNGPEHIALQDMPPPGQWGRDQRQVARTKIVKFNETVLPADRLPIVDWSLIIGEAPLTSATGR